MNQLNHMRHISNADKKLNEMKLDMINLEGYKKVTLTEGPGYYDCYRKCNIYETLKLSSSRKSQKILVRHGQRSIEEAQARNPLSDPQPLWRNML